MAQDIDLFLPDVFTYVAKCPEPLALRMIRAAARKLCRNMLNWKEWDETPVSTPDCEALIAVQDAEIIKIESATLDGADLDPQTPQWLDDNVPGWSDLDTGTGQYVTQLTPKTLTIVPKVTGLLRSRLVLEPSRQALTLPDFLLDQHSDLIGKGAAGMVLQTPGDHSNPQLGLKLEGDFKAGIQISRHVAARGQQRAPVRTKPRFF